MKKRDIIIIVFMIMIVWVLGWLRYNRYKSLKDDGGYTVGIVTGKTSNGKGEMGYINYKYMVEGKFYKESQGNLIFEAEPESGKFVVLYNKSFPHSSIIWLNYPCPNYDLGTSLDSVVIKSRVQISPWNIDLVVDGW